MADSPLLVTVPDARMRDLIGPVPEGVELVVWDMTGPAPADEIGIVVLHYFGAPVGALEHLRDVRVGLVQGQAIGYEYVVDQLPPGHVFANAATVHESGAAEHALALTLASRRMLPEFLRGPAGQWPEFAAGPGLIDARVLLLGYGGINQRVEDRLGGFECEVVRVASTARETPRGHVHGVDELPALLPGIDVVIAALPHTPATDGLIDRAFLAALPDGAVVVNIARGRIADTNAILAEAGRLRFALDVTEPEPLPEGHPLLDHPAVIVTPHVASRTTGLSPRQAALVRTQIGRVLAGEPPINVVHRT